MYKSKYEVERKMKQVRFALDELKKFKNRVFIKNGIDAKSACYPIEVRLITFITLARSVFQYAHKETANDHSKRLLYEAFISTNKIISFFKELRDSEIHSFSISSKTQISALSPIGNFNKETGVGLGKPFNLVVEDLSEIDNPKSGTSEDVKIHSQITRRVVITPALITTLKNENKHDLVEAIANGEELFEGLEFDGVTDMYNLCEMYYTAIVKFVDHGISRGFIT